MTQMLQKLLSDGWEYHDTQSERLANELESAAEGGLSPALLAPFLHLSMHTIGQHLSDWRRALSLGKRVLEAGAGASEKRGAAERVYVAAVLSGDAIGAAELELAALESATTPLAGFAAMRFLLADVLMEAGHRAEAGHIYRGALAITDRLERTPDLDRRIATASNNIAWTLHALTSSTADEVGMMRLAAEESAVAWRRCGDWVNIELALYLQASVAQAAGDPATALTLSTAGLELIAANGTRPFDAASFHLLRSLCFDMLGQTEQRLRALGEADRAAEDLASEALRAKFAAERSNALRRFARLGCNSSV
jgi:tetratricopeptide (TPR) repeat protein